jgi:hypothetical protein
MSISLHRGRDWEPGVGWVPSRGLRETGREGFCEWSVCFCGGLKREPGGGHFSGNFEYM